MKYETEIVIKAPREKVTEFFTSYKFRKEWQPNLEKIEHLTKEKKQKGAKAKLVYRGKAHAQEMVEEITTYRPPERFDYIYTVPGVKNIMKNRFIELDKETTKWISENEFIFFKERTEKMKAEIFEQETLNSMKMFRNYVRRKMEK